MDATLDDQVRMMDSSWFMSYPHDVYARLRREAPVYLSPRDQVWAISKYEDVRWISKTPELFANGYHVYVTAAAAQDTGQEIDGDTGMPRQAEIRRVDGLGPTRVDNLVMTDGDRHRFLRKIASHAFTPKAINQLESQVQQIQCKQPERHNGGISDRHRLPFVFIEGYPRSERFLEPAAREPRPAAQVLHQAMRETRTE